MKKLISVFGFAILFCSHTEYLFAQNTDCPTAITLCNEDTLNVTGGVYSGGNIAETPTCWFVSDIDSHWYSFTCTLSGSFTFSCLPIPYADFDFALYDITNSTVGTCNYNNLVSCNYSVPIGNGTIGIGCSNGTDCNPVVSLVSIHKYALVINRYTTGSTSGFQLSFGGTAQIGIPISVIANGPTTFCAGGSVLLTASSGTGYQWYKNNVAINGATNQTYTATTTATFKVVVNTICGAATSSDVQVVKNPLPTVSIAAVGSTTICSGDSVLLTSTVSPLTVTYQWLKANVAISGATNSSYYAKTSGKYSVTVTNTITGCAKTSAQILVTVKPLPSASITPSGSVTICAGDVLALIAVTNTGNQFQWKKNGLNISGATNQTYSATVAGAYRVFITNSFGCQKLSAQKIVSTMICRVEEYENISSNEIKIYPNPTDGTVNISSTLAIDNVECFNSIGQLVFQKPFESEIDLSAYPAGNYLLKLNYENGKSYKIYKVMVVR